GRSTRPGGNTRRRECLECPGSPPVRTVAGVRPAVAKNVSHRSAKHHADAAPGHRDLEAECAQTQAATKALFSELHRHLAQRAGADRRPNPWRPDLNWRDGAVCRRNVVRIDDAGWASGSWLGNV